jgi:hypothetical protein
MMVESESDMKIDLLNRAQMIQSARIQELARTSILGIIADIFHKQAGLLGYLFSIAKVASVMRLVVTSEGRKNSVSIPLTPQPSFSSHDHGNCR